MMNVRVDLFEFENIVGFWGGAKEVWAKLTDDEKEFLNECCSGCDFECLTAINDFVWFDAEAVLHIGDED